MPLLKPRSTGLDLAHEHLKAGRYLTALRLLRSVTAEQGNQLWLRTLLLWALNSVDPWGEGWRFSGPGFPLQTNASAAEPVETIVDLARGRRAVVIMEAHAGPETRFLGSEVLPKLKATGYTHLAFETFAQKPLDQFARDGILRGDTAIYAFEPSRAHILRIARALGLRIVAFDFPRQGARRLFPRSKATSNRDRDRDMAENVVAATVMRDPAARTIVWTGEQHAMRRGPSPQSAKGAFMAAHLARLLNEEPLCVGQIMVRTDAPWPSPRILQEGHQFLLETGLDVAVLHGRPEEPARPAWLDRGRSRITFEARGAELVQAVPTEEGKGAVPADQLLTRDGSPALRVPPGKYLVRGLAGDDSKLWSFETTT